MSAEEKFPLAEGEEFVWFQVTLLCVCSTRNTQGYFLYCNQLGKGLTGTKDIAKLSLSVNHTGSLSDLFAVPNVLTLSGLTLNLGVKHGS